ELWTNSTWGRLVLIKAGLTVTFLFGLGWMHRTFSLTRLADGKPRLFMILAVLECMLVMAFATAAGSAMAVQTWG
ncbi:MAG TPA: hypothetical protein VIU11_28200, partial [Nakamurella sp.]